MHAQPPVSLQVLGRFTLAVDGAARPVAGWRSRRAAELVQLIALEPSLGLPHEQAIEALWPHLDPAAGSANLRKAAHLARQSVGADDTVVLRGGRVWLFPDRTVTCDAHAFEQAADAALAAGSPATALQWYGRLRTHHEQTLGVRPGVQTEALYRTCFAGLQPRGPSFVGRAGELARANAWLEAAAAAGAEPRAGGLVIAGPAGIGKSSLARRIAADARAGGWQVIQLAADARPCCSWPARARRWSCC